MAQASGPANAALKPADFVHPPSKVHYRIYSENNRAWLSFEKEDDPSVRGKRELLYFVGSGRRGRSYLFETGGFLFESPVNWYSNKQLWDMAPAYQEAREIPLNLPAFTSCLHCHVSGMQPPVAGTENRYPTPVFTENGVACERCHGPGAAHLKGGSIVNPRKLPAARRDAVCMQCHLEGKVAIEQPGKHVYEFHAGEDLSEYIRYYVLANDPNSRLGAVSQVEAFADSTCKTKSGDSMSCTSCHDPHFSPSTEERTAYYRGKCLQCHKASFASQHHASQPDCTSCHMPSSASKDIAHTQVTDHRILRRPTIGGDLLKAVENTTASAPRLLAFPSSLQAQADDRSLALAYEALSQNGVESARGEAKRRLEAAMGKVPQDAALLSSLAYEEQQQGGEKRARELYEKALAADPNELDAAVNLGVIEAHQGNLGEAVKLWQDAFSRAPGRSAIGMNLALSFCASGQKNEARTYVLRVLEFDPDRASAKKLLHELDQDHPNCER
jgi:predicted CXXCH cytochrome family protein